MTIEVPDIGTVKFERSIRARRLIIRITPLKGIRVAVPQGVSFETALRFFVSKTTWVKNHLSKIKKYEDDFRDFIEQTKQIDIEAARRELIGRLDYWSERLGFNYNKVFIRNQKTRWGSCSARNNINLNIKLVKLPQELRDYVLIHELVHTKYKSHSRQFWQELDKYVDNAKGLSKKISKYHLS